MVCRLVAWQYHWRVRPVWVVVTEVLCLLARLYDTREKELIESFVDDVMELVELEPNKDALVRLAATTTCIAQASWAWLVLAQQVVC